MNEECLICKAPLEYLSEDTLMECAICRKREHSKTRCVKGHYICSECHTSGMDSMLSLCLEETGTDPTVILKKLMSAPFCHMHGPEHHTLVGASLLTAYKNSGGSIDLPKALAEMHRRANAVPGGACGFWGACGAGVGTGMYISIATGATPLAREEWGLANQMTARALQSIGEIGGPRCCKRDSYLAIQAAVDFTRKNLGVSMEPGSILCSHSAENNQCIHSRCPFYHSDE